MLIGCKFALIAFVNLSISLLCKLDVEPLRDCDQVKLMFVQADLFE